MMSLAEIERQFSEFISDTLGATVDTVADGELYRFAVPKDKGGQKSGWCVCHGDGAPNGQCGDFHDGVTYQWQPKQAQRLSPLERQRYAKEARAKREKREQQKLISHKEAAALAQSIFSSAQRATKSNPYAQRKNIIPWCAREKNGNLLIPLQDATGGLSNIQTIYKNGDKRYLKNAKKQGCFCLVGRAIPEEGTVYICEGYATACTVASELKAPVIAAMDAGNLEPVALAIREIRPHSPIVILADNDHRNKENTGKIKGQKAALAVKGGIQWPALPCGEKCQCTDFNDTANCGSYRA